MSYCEPSLTAIVMAVAFVSLVVYLCCKVYSLTKLCKKCYKES